MSTVSTIHEPEQGSYGHPDDPFRYGWRYVCVQHPDGTETCDQIPLTPDDVLHPKSGDFIVQSDAHDDDAAYLKSVFKSRLVNDPHAAVISDCLVDWNLPEIRPIGPDAAVFFNVKQPQNWTTLDVAAERAKPALVVEVTSPSTRKNDFKIKFDYYHRAQVPLYVIADAGNDGRHDRRLRLFAYRYRRERYEPIAPDASGRVWLEPVGMLLGVSRDPVTGCDRLACFDPGTGEEIGDYLAVIRAAGEAKAKAEAAGARADAEAARADAEAARADAESGARIVADSHAATAAARAEAEACRADVEAARAEAEFRARADAETRAETEARARRGAETRADDEALARTAAEARAAAAEARLRELESAGKPQV